MATIIILLGLLAALVAPPAEDRVPGVTFRVYRVDADLHVIPRIGEDQTPNLDVVRPVIDYRLDEDFGSLPAPIVTTTSGWLHVEAPGPHRFRLTSDDGSRLFIGGRLLIDHDGRHGATALASPPIELEPGHHELLIEHFDHVGKRRVTLEWTTPPTGDFTLIPTAALSTHRDLTRVTAPGFKRIEDHRRPGDGRPLNGVHPGWTVHTIRPQGFEPLVGAMTFLPDGRLVVGTFSPLQRDDRSLPDIESKPPDTLYGLSGVTGPRERIEVDVVADGLLEPSGLCAVGDALYVSERRSIQRLLDRDGDGFFETHETVGAGWEAWNYHQFAFGLVHGNGKLYGALSTAMAPPAWEGMGTNAAPNGPMRGGIVEVDLSSNQAHVIAGGTRAPNGIGWGPEGSLWYLDNQGAWMPTSQLAEVIPGRFYGHHNRTNLVPKLADRFPIGGHPSVFSDRPRTPGAVLLAHNEASNSPTQPVLIDSGPFAGQLYVGELTAGGIRRVFLERVNGQWQGAVFRFTQGLESGVNRLIQGPDGSLYAGGIGAGGNWNWRNTKFGLQRLTPTGRGAFEMHSVRALPDGFAVKFTRAIDLQWLADPANYRIKQWRYEPTAEYGGPKIDEQMCLVRAAEPADDGRSVRLRVDGLLAGCCVHLRTDPVALDGEPIWSTEAWYTLNFIPREVTTPATIGGRPVVPTGVGVGVLPPAGAVPLLGPIRGAAPGDAAPNDPDQRPDVVEVGMGSGDMTTPTLFGDCRLHIEWLSPPGGSGQLAGNSGVFLQDRYELQVLGTPAGEQWLTLEEAGAIYGIRNAFVNASTGPGSWQAYDLWFRAPRFHDGEKTADARITVYWNGRLVHDDVAIPTPTGSRAERGESAEHGGVVQLGPLVLQDHASDAEGPVRYRNIWIATLAEMRYEPRPWVDLFETQGPDVPAGWMVRGGAAEFHMDGATVVGASRPNTTNTFLVTEATYDDFELLFEVKQDRSLNSGVQIRSGVIGGIGNRDGGLRGYQVELDPTDRAYTGGIYDERRRGWLHDLAHAPYARRAYRPEAWNRLRVVATGPVIQTWVNGVPAATMFDAMTADGHIGLQVHGVGDRAEPLEVRFRDVRIRALRAIDER